MTRPDDSSVAAGLVAGAVAGGLSGAPSTIHAIWRGGSVATALRAAGTLLGRATILRGLAAHVCLSLGWGVVLAAILPRRHRMTAGAVAGLGIAALDLGVVGRRIPRIRALPQLPQLLDHVAYGATVGAVIGLLDRRRRDAAHGNGAAHAGLMRPRRCESAPR